MHIQGFDWFLIVSLAAVQALVVAAMLRAGRPRRWVAAWALWLLGFWVIEIAGAFSGNTFSESVVASFPRDGLTVVVAFLALDLIVHFRDLANRLGRRLRP